MEVTLSVAPHAGAWIETIRAISWKPGLAVAPHAGAWIETAQPPTARSTASVAPHAGRGLKPAERAYHRLRKKSPPPYGGMD